MDSTEFYSIVKNYSSLTEEECREIEKISNEFPYSQLINLIHARVKQDLKHPDREKLLHYAAVYSTERAVLKKIMTSPRSERVKQVEKVTPEPVSVAVEEAPKAEEKVLQPQVKEEVTAPKKEEKAPVEILQSKPERVTLSGDALRDDLYHELEKLQRLKLEFTKQVEAFQTSSHVDSTVKAKSKVVKGDENPLIEEIKTTKKKLAVDGPKQKEQNEIIDQFITTKPSLPKIKPSEPAKDLAEDSAMLGDNVVSETLVDLLIKQGKNDKAIEVLKKLIWKFPQKKAYFAAQIDSLKS